MIDHHDNKCDWWCMTDVFQKNEINLLTKFAKIMKIFDKVDDSKT